MCADERRAGPAQRARLQRLFRYFAWTIAAAVVYVLLDFSIDLKPSAVHSSYRFTVPVMDADDVRVLRQDNLSILVIRRSDATRQRLEQAAPTGL